MKLLFTQLGKLRIWFTDYQIIHKMTLKLFSFFCPPPKKRKNLNVIISDNQPVTKESKIQWWIKTIFKQLKISKLLCMDEHAFIPLVCFWASLPLLCSMYALQSCEHDTHWQSPSKKFMLCPVCSCIRCVLFSNAITISELKNHLLNI